MIHGTYIYYIIRLYYNYILDKFDKQVAEEAVQWCNYSNYMQMSCVMRNTFSCRILKMMHGTLMFEQTFDVETSGFQI